MNSTNVLWRMIRGTMKEQRYWYLKCKICKNLHRSEIAVTDSRCIYQFPTAGEIKCPDSPDKKAQYSPSQDWIALTEAEAQMLRKASWPAREHIIRTFQAGV
jgi:hypothetical protein